MDSSAISSTESSMPLAATRGAGCLKCSNCAFITKHTVRYRVHLRHCKVRTEHSPRTVLPDPPVRRNYTCRHCEYRTSKAKLFLYHRRFAHAEDINVFPCDRCEYASKNKSKTLRHCRLVHKITHKYTDLKAANSLIGVDWSEIDIISHEGKAHEGKAEGSIMNDENQNEVLTGDRNLVIDEPYTEDVEEDEDEDEEEEGEFEDIDEEIAFKSPDSHKRHPDKGKLAEDTYEYIMTISEGIETPVYQCQLCSFQCPQKWKINSHVRAMHLKRTIFKCPFCDFVCRRKIEWCVHKTEHTKKHVFACEECLYKTTIRRNFDRHIARHGNYGPFKCSVCSYSSTGEAAIQRHISDYHDSPSKEKENLILRQQARNKSPTPMQQNGTAKSITPPSVLKGELQCEECPLKFDTEAKLRQHMIAHSPNAPFDCPVCMLKYKRPADLNRHMKRKHNVSLQDFRGSPCHTPEHSQASGQDEPLNLSVKKSFNELGEQEEPLDLTTPKKDTSHESEASPTERRVFNCYKCDTSYKYESDLNEHLRVIHYIHVNRDDSKDDSDGGEDGGIARLDCQYCPYVGSYPAEVERHMKTHTDEEQLWACVFCPFRATWKIDMKRHLQRHHTTEVAMCGGDLIKVLSETYQGDGGGQDEGGQDEESSDGKMLAVDESDQSFSDSSSKKQSFNCPHCPVVCDAPSKLRCHIEIHGNLKRFMCSHCGRRSNWLWDVRKHIKKDHPGKNLEVMELPEEEARATLEDYLQSIPPSPASDKSAAENSLSDSESYSNNTASARPTKATDRCRPFMCSACGRRSNWRWDMNKHIRSLHPSAELITLSDQEARDTFEGYEKMLQQQSLMKSHCSAVQQQHQQKQSTVFTSVQAISHQPAAAIDNETDEIKQLVTERLRPFKCSTCAKRSNWRWDLGKHIKSMHGGKGHIITLSSMEARAGYREFEIQQLRKELERDNNLVRPPAAKRAPSQSHIDLSKLKRFKCSLCPYRSNFRSDIGRHIKRKHHRGLAKVTQLDPEEAAATLDEYHHVWARKKFVPTPISTPEKPPTPKRRRVDEHGDDANDVEDEFPRAERQKVRIISKQWKCVHCEFSAEEKDVVARHITEQHRAQQQQPQSHMCKECGDTFSVASALSEHCRVEHDMLMIADELTGNDAAEDEEDTSADMKEVEVESEVSQNAVVSMARCRLCGVTSMYTSVIKQHAADTHSTSDEQIYLEEYFKLQESVTSPSRVIHCPVCPFTASKQVVMDLHTPHHKPQPHNPYKCPHCPYWVGEAEALDHHLRLHGNGEDHHHHQQQQQDVYDFSMDFSDDSMMPPPSSTPSKCNARSRHFCEYCPYVSANRNDYLYHKQFHRPKPAAPYKCDHCQYWVSLRRLLKQHVKVHSAEYQQKYRRDMLDAEYSPAKSDDSSVPTNEIIELAQLKQKIIAGKITSVMVTPEKVHQRSYVPKHGTPVVKSLRVDHYGHPMGLNSYRTMLKCRFCPYRNVRSTNLKLHEKMHGNFTGQSALKCPYCDYHVGNAGVLARHIKVHSANYDPSMDDMNDIEVTGKGEVSEEDVEDSGEGETLKLPLKDEDIQKQLEENDRAKSRNSSQPMDVQQLPQKCDYYLKESADNDEVLLEKALFRKLCCERCPYATMKRSQFERHMSLHGCRQKYTCEYCDYSVPSYHLLLQHKKLHLMPNRNLLAMQSVSNLQKLPEIPADVALAGNLPGDKEGIHGHMELYENSKEFMEPKQMYRCDKCPYANVRRDHLLQHLKFHMVKSEFQCPYCSYSVSKTHLLNQHIRVHFNAAGGEMSAFSRASAGERVKRGTGNGGAEEYIDIAELGQQMEGEKAGEEGEKATDEAEEDGEKETEVMDLSANDVLGDGDDSLIINMDDKDISGVNLIVNETQYACKYCDRVFAAKELLDRHEKQHKVGTAV